MLHQVGVSFDLYCDAWKHKIKINNTRDKKKWIDHFTSLYAGTMETSRITPEDADRVEINETEVVEVIQKWRNRTTPGEDGITNEMIKYGGYKLWQEINNK